MSIKYLIHVALHFSFKCIFYFKLDNTKCHELKRWESNPLTLAMLQLSGFF